MCFFVFAGLFGVFCIPSSNAAPFIEPEMLIIPAGTFLYGSSDTERRLFLISEREPRQMKMFVDTFLIGQYEITNEEYALFINDGGYEQETYWSDEGWKHRLQFSWTEPRRWRDKDYNKPGKENYPVCAVSWFEAEAYCRWLSVKTGKPYRLPTALEWEKAARGVDGRFFPWGNEWNVNACNWLADVDGNTLPDKDIDGYFYTSPVGKYPAGQSPYGCYDMSGNVLEWCSDGLEEYPGVQHPAEYRIFKGGSFFTGNPRQLRCAWRGGTWPEIGHVYWGIIGFRVAADSNP